MQELKYSKITPENISNFTKKDILAEIRRLESEKDAAANANSSLKIIINSFYGVLGYAPFVLYERNVARAVTGQSRAIIQQTEKIFNDYFIHKWHLDKEGHEAMGIVGEVRRVEHPVVNYLDTDSCFVLLKEIFEDAISCGYAGEFKQFVMDLDKHCLRSWVNEKLTEFARTSNADAKDSKGVNYQNLELEESCFSVLWIKKKKYIKHITWGDGIDYEFGKKIKVKGIEINQKSTPKWARSRLKELVDGIMKMGHKLDIRPLAKKIDIFRNQFELLEIRDICLSIGVNGYDKYILEDNKNLQLADRCPIHLRAAGHYNWLLGKNNNPKYSRINSGSKIMFYYCENSKKDLNVFGFPDMGKHPYEFAPKPDYDRQFERVILNPVNNILKAAGAPPIVIGNAIFTLL